jgi:bifunctional non-homologous end joining protein LigD
MTTKQVVHVEGKSLQLSNLDKVLWPKAGLTKANLLEYHARLYAVTKRHWQQRALTVTRYPHGVEGDFFFQKNIPSSAPPWVKAVQIADTNYIVANDLATITWLANQAAIEFHPSTYLVSRTDVPSYAIIDLDPTKPAGFAETVEIAKYCRDLLEEMDLCGYPKLSGVTGIHIYIPLHARYSFPITSQLVKFIGITLQRLHPRKVTLERLVKKRHGVYIDYMQNHPGRTIAGVYSPRPTPEATVSTPVRWEDLDYFEPRDFTLQTVPSWIDARGDLFEPVLSRPQGLEHLQNLQIFQ